MARKDLDSWNLKDLIRQLNTKIGTIEEIYLFGSRGYNTGSYRSDIDLMVYTKQPIRTAEISHWLYQDLNAVDLFETNDKTIGRSILNGSSIATENGNLVNEIDAILLWDNINGYSSTFDRWEQFTLKNVSFIPTLLPIPNNFEGIARKFTSILEEKGYPNTFLGTDWEEVLYKISSIISQSIDVPEYFNARAKFISKNNFKLNDEYDFQNLIHIVLKPWLPSVDSENLVIRYNDQNKNADFSILKNTIIIEAKHIKTDNDRAGILKTVEGLKEFYKQNANVKGLLFLILVNKSVVLDDWKIESDFSYKSTTPIVLTKIIRNRLE